MKTGVFAMFMALAFGASAAENPIDRWAGAVGGRDKLAALTSIYREATLEFGPYKGTLKVWHTADGKYRKEEQIATMSSIETFDGREGFVQQGEEPPHKMTPAEVATAASKRFANSNALFFVFFPERRRGTVAIEGNDTVVLKPEGGIEWRVVLDPEKGLPKNMIHTEGGQTVTVTFKDYETVDGYTFEKELWRAAGNAGQSAKIRFTKTVVNVDTSGVRFSMDSSASAALERKP